MPMESIKFLTNKCFVVILFIFASCSENNLSDHRLTNFEIIDSKLDSVTEEIITSLSLNKKLHKDSLYVGLSLNQKKDTIVFEYSLYNDIDDVKTYNVIAENRRVIGYTQKNDINIILFSDINRYNEMMYTLKKFIKPTTKYKKFDLHNEYIRYEEWGNEYIIDKLKACFDYHNGQVSKHYTEF